MDKVIFITGTDTGVGKTLLTALLLRHLRQKGVHALAMKPFCSGGTGDVRLLQSLQSGELSDAEMNPFYFAEPIAPLVAAKRTGTRIDLNDVVDKIKSLARKCERLLIEGSGGLLVPLGSGYTVADLIRRLQCCVVIVARNRLGTINHSLLTCRTLRNDGVSPRKQTVVLMDGTEPDRSCSSNQAILAELLAPSRVLRLPYLGSRLSAASQVKAASSKVRQILTKLTDAAR